MDVFLRRENGLDVAAWIMRQSPRPILIVTGANASDPQLAFRAVQAGALDVSHKLPSQRSPEYGRRRERLLRLVKSLAMVPVVGRRRGAGDATLRKAAHRQCAGAETAAQGRGVLVIGASTGGPPAVLALLCSLDAPFALPIAVVQHIAEGFTEGFRRWLAHETRHPIVTVETAAHVVPATVYLPADGKHLVFTSPSTVASSNDPPEGHQRPSVDLLFKSAARHFAGNTIAVIMTGMGRDGCAGMVALKQAGAFTIAQKPESCVVGSMPSHVIEAGAADRVVLPGAMVSEIMGRIGRPRHTQRET